MAKPNLNDGTPWSQMALLDLRVGLERGDPIDEIADFLCRSEREVRDKAIELGLLRRPILDAIQAIDGIQRRRRDRRLN